MKCFYHNDNDGKAAAFCIFKYVKTKAGFTNRCIPMDYGKKFPFDEIQKDEDVWIVDYSIDPKEMERLLEITPNVVWIDHHKTAIAKYKDFKTPIAGARVDGTAGCVLTWKYVRWCTDDGAGPQQDGKDGLPAYPASRRNERPVPKAIDLVGDFDVWTFHYGDETRLFGYASGAYDTKPSSEFWDQCTAEGKAGEEFMARLQEEGGVIMRYNEQRHAELRDAIGFETEFEGHKCFAMNLAKTNSEAMGGDEALKKYDILIPFYYDGKGFSFSLYSGPKTDVSEIAKKYGGGGHKNASGFTSDTVPFKKIEKKEE